LFRLTLIHTYTRQNSGGSNYTFVDIYLCDWKNCFCQS